MKYSDKVYFETNAKSLSSLHDEALRVVRDLKKQEFLLIELIQKIDQKKLHRFLGFKSVFSNHK